MMTGPIHLLMVEDNPGDVDLAREALSQARGFLLENLHVATDGEQAMRFVRQHGEYVDAPRPDLILLDLNLPRKDGREVLAEIKSDPLLCAIPVVVLTSSDSQEDVARSYRLHANCYVKKPGDLDRFLEIVRRIEQFWLSVAQLPDGSGGGYDDLEGVAAG